MNDIITTIPNGHKMPLREYERLKETERSVIEHVREALLQTQARQLRSQEWFDFASDGYLLTDLHGVVHEANYAAAKLLGVRKEFLLGKPLGLFMSEENVATFYERLTRLATRSDGEHWEARVCRPAGQPREVILTAAADSSEDGIQLRWVLRDITELRHAQRQTSQAERLAAIGQMAAGLAHEGRNALQRIQACVAILTMRLKGHPEELDLLARIQRAQDDLQHLFEDVRDYAVAPRLQRSWLDLRQCWREAWNELAGLPQWRDAELIEDIDGIEPCCRADPFYLKHVLRNLLENALTCGANPVRIAIHCRPAALAAAEAICLRLRDNGPGIPAAARARLFEPFCTTKARGSGLGLAICKRIVEAHGGQIEARSYTERGNEKTGAEIVITLPRRAP